LLNLARASMRDNAVRIFSDAWCSPNAVTRSLSSLPIPAPASSEP
jgi:hypothetical protein